jgi:hypothetical protein
LRASLSTLSGILVLALGACAHKEAAPAAGSAASGAAATPSAASTAPPEVRFVARDFAFEGPDTIAAGMTTLVLHNAGPSLHHVLLLRLANGRTAEDLRAAVLGGKPPGVWGSWFVMAGGVSPVDPGKDARATLMIEPGAYAVVCLVSAPGHVPHMRRGMITGLTVTPSTPPAATTRTSDLTLTEVDFAYAFSSPPTAGRHVIEVWNAGKQPHELQLIRLAPGKTLADLERWTRTLEGAPPGESLGGAAPMAPGQVEYVPVDLTPGDYVAFCLVLDRATHKTHMAQGMVLPFTIS